MKKYDDCDTENKITGEPEAYLPGDMFRAALCEEIKRLGWGAQSSLADKIGMSRSHMNDIVKGRSAGPEEQRVRISEILGVNYEEMLAYGRQLLEGKVTDEDVQVFNFRQKVKAVDEKAVLLEGALDAVDQLYKEAGDDNGLRSKSSAVIGFYRTFLEKKNIDFPFDEITMERAVILYHLAGKLPDLLSNGEWVLMLYENMTEPSKNKLHPCFHNEKLR